MRLLNYEMSLFDILNPNKNGLRESPPEFKFMISLVHRFFWFGI